MLFSLGMFTGREGDNNRFYSFSCAQYLFFQTIANKYLHSDTLIQLTAIFLLFLNANIFLNSH